MMNTKKRLAAAATLLAMLLTLCSCSVTVVKKPDGEPKPAVSARPTVKPSETPDGGEKDERTHFTQVWHGDMKYSEMGYEHYELEWFEEYTAPIYAFAEDGGGEEEFADADYDICEELSYIYTLAVLMNISSSADPYDSELADEYAYAMNVYYSANDAYFTAMRTLALSEHAALLESLYPGAIIDIFRSYEPDDGSGAEAYDEENRLVAEYYRLMAEDETDYDAVGEIYLKLVALRREKAGLYGYGSFAEYAYDSIFCKDYTPEDARAVWQGVKEQIVPVMKYYGSAAYNEALLLEASNTVDCSSEAILAAMDSALADMSGELYDAYRYMIDYELYDIDHNPGKANTGFTTKLHYLNEPYIFNAAYDEFYDYTDMFHEFGHFVNAFYTESDLLFGVSDNDLCELQSQGMELLFTHYYPDIFGGSAGAAEKYVLVNMISSIVDGALYDEFQQRVYAEDGLTVERVNEIYAELYEEYGYNPYDGYETEWMDISHNFENPFYYISYCVSALGALEIYSLSLEDWDAAVDRYLDVCALDTEAYYYSEALEEAGLGDIFEPGIYDRIAAALTSGLQ